jgi:hypothetical protein
VEKLLTYLPRHVDLVLRDELLRTAVCGLRERLKTEKARLMSDRPVVDTADAVQWLLEDTLVRKSSVAMDPAMARRVAEAKLRGVS